MPGSSTARVLPMRAPADQPHRAYGRELFPILCCNLQSPCLGPFRALETTTNERGRAPRADEDCLGLSPWLLSKADSTVGAVPERGLGLSCSSTSGSPEKSLLQC